MVVPIQVKVMLPLRDHSLGPQFVLYRWLYGPHACYYSIYLHAALLLPHDAYFLTWPLSWLVPWTTILSSLPRPTAVPLCYDCAMSSVSPQDKHKRFGERIETWHPLNPIHQRWQILGIPCVRVCVGEGRGGDKDCMHLIIQSKSRCACV